MLTLAWSLSGPITIKFVHSAEQIAAQSANLYVDNNGVPQVLQAIYAGEKASIPVAQILCILHQ